MKIVQVINAMISNQGKISNVKRREAEYFFQYDNKYVWSINMIEDDYVLYLYPDKDATVERLVAFDDHDFIEYPYVTYRNKEIKSKESTESFSELYRIVVDKLLGVDLILDDILLDF